MAKAQGKPLRSKGCECFVSQSAQSQNSMVENLNSRLRNYLFLQLSLGDDYLNLLRFFLNHRQFLRSRILERVGKIPRELLTEEAHPHWLELLGFDRFQRA